MNLISKKNIINDISPPIDFTLATCLFDEFVSLERRFIQRDWEPAELDGGQFCEILSRILYHIDSGKLSFKKEFNSCCKYIENDTNKHIFLPRYNALHIVKMLRTVYKFRSQRGAVHITLTYSPNHMDSKLIVECVRWLFSETLRLFWNGDREIVAKAIRELLQFDVPCIGKFEEILLVQRTDLNTEEELLVLLHYAGEDGFSRRELGKYTLKSPSQVTNTLTKLLSSTIRQIVRLNNGNYRLTDLGSKRIREDLSDKLLLE